MEAVVWVDKNEELTLFKVGQYEKGCDVTRMGVCWLSSFL